MSAFGSQQGCVLGDANARKGRPDLVWIRNLKSSSVLGEVEEVTLGCSGNARYVSIHDEIKVQDLLASFSSSVVTAIWRHRNWEAQQLGYTSMNSLFARFLRGFSLTVLAVFIPMTSALAVYPDKPIKMIVPFSPGGGTDSVARSLAAGMSQVLGQPVIVENKPGAGTIIGSEFVAKSAPDGYTLLVATFAHAVNPSLIPAMPFDTDNAFAAVGMVAKGPNVLVVRSDSALKSIKDLVEAAKLDPLKLSFASQGNGTSAHLAGEMFENLAQVKMTHIPYRGAGPAMTDLLSGQVDMMFATASAISQHISSGELRALGVTSLERSPVLKLIPSISETVPGFALESWYALFVCVGTPHEIISKLNDAINKTAQTTNFRGKLEPQGLVVSTGSPQELEAYVKREEMRWRKIVKENNIKAD